MKVLEFTAESFRELIVLQCTENLRKSDSWITGVVLPQLKESKINFQKYFALLGDEYDSEVEAESNILEVLAVHYLPQSNCGFVRFLRLQNCEKNKEDYTLNCDWGQSLIKEAENSLNTVRITVFII